MSTLQIFPQYVVETNRLCKLKFQLNPKKLNSAFQLMLPSYIRDYSVAVTKEFPIYEQHPSTKWFANLELLCHSQDDSLKFEIIWLGGEGRRNGSRHDLTSVECINGLKLFDCTHTNACLFYLTITVRPGYEWTTYRQQMLHKADLSKMFSLAVYPDCAVISEDGQRFEAHRCLLAVKSRALRAELKKLIEAGENGEEEIIIEVGFPAKVCKLMLNYIYTAAYPPVGLYCIF